MTGIEAIAELFAGPVARDYLATYLSDHEYDLKKLMEHIATSAAYQARAAVRMSEYSLKPGFVASETAKRRGPIAPPTTVVAPRKAAIARAERFFFVPDCG